MSNDIKAAAGSAALEARGLNPAERVVDAFIAPSKTFTDILRNTSWWLPFLLIALMSFASAFVVDRQVGFERVTETQIHASPKSEDRLNQLPPEQKAQQIAISAKITKIMTYSVPVILLVVYALYALIMWAGFNFGLGAQTTYAQVFAVTWYALLPFLFTSLLTIITLYFGGNAEAYDIRNPVGTNPAFYLPDAAPWLKALLTQIDVIRLWSLALQVIGMAIIAKKTIAQSAIVVVGWWIIVVVVSTGLAAAFS